MGINVRIQKAPKQKAAIVAEAKLEKDLRSCMHCRFFYGNNSQCIAKKCVKEDRSREMAGIRDKRSACDGCSYGQTERYCFPCMKKLLGYKEREIQNDLEQEEKKDG